MIAGRLTNKRGYWHMVLELKHDDGKRYPKWVSTGLKAPGNKKLAEELLYEKRIEYTRIADIKRNSRGIYFDSYLKSWLVSKKEDVSASTYMNYFYMVNRIARYFQEKKILLSGLKPIHITEFYTYLKDGGTRGGVVHYHRLMNQALKHAYINELIIRNPVDSIKRPKEGSYNLRPYTDVENQKLLQSIKGNKIELAVLIALHTGLRRSEILGLKWQSIDFANNTILVDHAIKYVMFDEKREIVGMDSLKSKASNRTLPMTKVLRERLLTEKKKIDGGSLSIHDNYICIDTHGEVLKPDYISKEFKKILKENNMRLIRFHDLRHGCADILIRNRVPLIEVQHWLGHTHVSTTADMYTHLTFDNKLQCSRIIDSSLDFDMHYTKSDVGPKFGYEADENMNVTSDKILRAIYNLLSPLRKRDDRQLEIAKTGLQECSISHSSYKGRQDRIRKKLRVQTDRGGPALQGL